MNKMWHFWVIAIIIALVAAYYQRTTGPTYPKKVDVTLNHRNYKILFKRSNEIIKGQSCDFRLLIPEKSVSAKLFYHRYPVDTPFVSIDFYRKGDTLIASIPNQKAAAKIVYYIQLKDHQEIVDVSKEAPVVLRFKGFVPSWALIPHIFLIFFAMILANLSGLLAVFRNPNYRTYTIVTFLFLLLGGMIFGPIVQKFAFNEFWAGIPKGWDLTDNKMLIAFVFWTFAMLTNLKKNRYHWVWIAALIILIIFSIPHSMFGSELDYSSGNIVQG